MVHALSLVAVPLSKRKLLTLLCNVCVYLYMYACRTFLNNVNHKQSYKNCL